MSCVYTEVNANDLTWAGLVLALLQLEQEGVLVLILPSASWKHQLCVQVLQEPEARMTSMGSPVCSGHIVVISWLLIGASVFGVWKTGECCSSPAAPHLWVRAGRRMGLGRKV